MHVKATFPEVRGKMNIIEEHQVIPSGAEVSIKGNYKSAYMVPSKKPVSIVQEDDYTVVSLPEVVGYAMIALEK